MVCMETITRAPLGGINRLPPQEAPVIKYCLYARKSTEEEDKQALEKQKKREAILEEAKNFYHNQLTSVLTLDNGKEAV